MLERIVRFFRVLWNEHFTKGGLKKWFDHGIEEGVRDGERDAKRFLGEDE